MSGLQVDLPYPSTTDFMRDECSVRIISPAYAGGASEMTAILQYIYHAVHFDCAGNKKFARILRDIAITEMHHLDMLAEMFCAMGVSRFTARVRRAFAIFIRRATSVIPARRSA